MNKSMFLLRLESSVEGLVTQSLCRTARVGTELEQTLSRQSQYDGGFNEKLYPGLGILCFDRDSYRTNYEQ